MTKWREMCRDIWKKAFSKVSIDVAWSPEDIDGRGYDYASLARYADLGMKYNNRKYKFDNFYDVIIISKSALFQCSWWVMTSRVRCGRTGGARPDQTLLWSKHSPGWENICSSGCPTASWSWVSPGTATDTLVRSSLLVSATSILFPSGAATALTLLAESLPIRMS